MKLTKTLITATLLASTMLASVAFAESREKAQISAEAATLSPDKAKLYNDTLKAASDSNKDLRDKIHKAHDESDAIMTAEKFDKAAFLAKQAELDGLYSQVRTKMNAAYVSVVEKLKQDERKILIKTRNDNRHKQP